MNLQLGMQILDSEALSTTIVVYKPEGLTILVLPLLELAPLAADHITVVSWCN